MTLIEPLLHSPRLPQYVRELESILAAERTARERFYDEMREDQKTEFINGEVIVHSPVKIEHANAAKELLRFLSTYVDKHQIGLVSVEKLLVTLTRNDYEPDICYFNSAKSDAFAAKQMKFPAPDMVVEILSPSTEKIDRKVKLEDYAAHGVDEYWIVDPHSQFIEQYLLNGDAFELAVKVQEGTIKSRAIKGLEFPVRAAFDRRLNLEALGKILQSPTQNQ